MKLYIRLFMLCAFYSLQGMQQERQRLLVNTGPNYGAATVNAAPQETVIPLHDSAESTYTEVENATNRVNNRRFFGTHGAAIVIGAGSLAYSFFMPIKDHINPWWFSWKVFETIQHQQLVQGFGGGLLAAAGTATICYFIATRIERNKE